MKFKMKFLHITSLFIIMNLSNAASLQGYGETHTREKRQNNIYDFLQHLLSASSSYFNSPQRSLDNTQTPSTYQSPIYSNSEQDKFIFNVNHPQSKPTTIINNVPGFNYCPCERYVRKYNEELDCLCPKKQIFTKCTQNTICVLKHLCDHGLLFDTTVQQQTGFNTQSDLCDESTHVCCLPPVSVKKQNDYGEEHEIYNHFINTSIEHLNNTVTKYVIHGNVYLNNGKPEFKTSNKNINYNDSQNSRIPTKFQPEAPSDPIQFIPKSNTQVPIQPDPKFNQRDQTEPNMDQSNQFEPNQFQPDQPFIPNKIPEKVSLTSIPEITEDKPENTDFPEMIPEEVLNKEQSSLYTKPPNLVRPTKPTDDSGIVINTSGIIVDQEIPEDTANSGDVVPSLNDFGPGVVESIFIPERNTDNNINQTLDDDILSVFGTQPESNFEEQIFPGLSQNTQNSNSQTTSDAADIPSTVLSQMEFPQSNLHIPMKSPQTFLTGRIETLRNHTRTNATTHNRVVQGIATRIFQDTATERFKPNIQSSSPAFNQVQEDFFPSTEKYVPMNRKPSNFAVPEQNTKIYKSCPSAMKCVQNRYCTPEGYVSSVPVILSKEEEMRKNILLNCGDEASGQIGKCCFDKNA